MSPRGRGILTAAVLVFLSLSLTFLPLKFLKSTAHSAGLPPVVSEDTRRNIEQFVSRNPNVAAVSLMNLDFQDNVRAPRVVVIGSPAVKKLYKPEQDRFPIFTTNKKQNDEMTSLIYGNSRCTPAAQGVFVSNYHLQGLIELSCRIPVSPIGRLAGYLVIHFVKTPGTDELSSVMNEANTLCISIFIKEIHDSR